MKGIIKLAPIENPVEGMQVVINKSDDNKIIAKIIEVTSQPENHNYHEIEIEGRRSYCSQSLMQQIVVEYYDIWEERGFDTEAYLMKTLPLHPEQWSWALAMIGHEVEFTTAVKYPGNGERWAKIITPTPSKDYIEEKNLKAKEFISEHGLPDGWGKKKITGEDVAALLHGIHTHAGEIANTVAATQNNDFISEEEVESKIYYAEDDLLPILKALGLPEPVWKNSISLDDWLKGKK